MKLFAVLTLMCLSSCLIADVYNVKPSISERELSDLYVEMLNGYCRYAEGFWHDSASDPTAGYWGNGISDGNEGIRAVANAALVHAVLVKKTDSVDAATRRQYLDRATRAIRYAARTHLTDTETCVDGKQWGNSWQSAMWAANVGFAAWILWDDLDPALRKSVETVVVYEADRFLDRKPGGNFRGDTKAEENGWDQIVISLAPNMFPEHPNAARWEQKSIEYMMNTVSVPQDANRTQVVDGRPVKDWVSTANYYPDFTLENHGFFHPSYTMVSPAEIGQGALFYAYAGRPIPEAAGHNLKENWALLQTIMHPHGYWAYTQGMDWALNSDGHSHYLAWLSAYLKDPLAYGMEKTVIQYIRGHQLLFGNGRFAGPASRLGFAREAVTAERLSYSLMFHQALGYPSSERTIRHAVELKGVRKHNFVDVMSHRTGSKYASFSWKNNIMGYVMPVGPGHEGNPYFTSPITNGLIGSFALKDIPAARPKPATRVWSRTMKGFETHGTLLVNGGTLKQQIHFASIGEKTVVYADRVTATSDVTITQELGVPFGIENDEFTGNKRTLHHQDGSQVISGPESDALIRISGKWANVDGRLGIVVLEGSGMAYRHVQDYNRDGAREDFLYGSYADQTRSLKAGDEAARRVVVLFVETSPEETVRLAEQMHIEKTPSGSVLHIALPEGGEYQLKLRF